MNVTCNACAPAFSTVPAAGEYVNVPGVFAVALSSAVPSAVPYTMSAGAGHVTIGYALFTDSVVNVVTVAWFTASVGVNAASSRCEPAGSTVPAAGE
jgi:hypothetical protein